MHKRAGLTLMELLITTFILSVGVLAAVGSFQYISTSTQFSKSRSLGSNLAQEQIEKLKNLSYYTLLVTTGSAYSDTRFSPALTYDQVYYAPAAIIEGGITFTRATRVDYASQMGTTISTLSWTTDDTGLKQITVYVIWREKSEWKYQQMQSLFANPAATPLNAAAAGTVTKASGGNLAGAYVQVIDNSNWYSNTDASGNYRFSVTPGSYTLQASSSGYYTSTTNGYQSFTQGNTTTVPFTLTAIASGTITGSIYKNDHLVISQVVASTEHPAGSGFFQEYVEVFNPTTWTWTVATGPGNPVIDLVYQKRSGPIRTITMDYNTWTIDPNRYYLFANISPVNAGGVSRNADAVFQASNAGFPNIYEINTDPGSDSAATAIMFTGASSTIDAVGWQKAGVDPDYAEGTPIQQAVGFQDGEQFVRATSPGTNSASYAEVYDTENNNKNFRNFSPMSYSPKNSSITGIPIAGTPATGANVSSNDLLQNSVSCTDTTTNTGYCSSVGGCNYCSFSLVASTGTWTLNMSTGISATSTLFGQIQNVVVQTNVSTSAPNGTTTPTWASVANNSVTLLSQTTDYAFVSGRIRSGTGANLSGITVSDGNGRTATTNSSGQYSLLSTTGSIILTANPDNASKNRAYTTQARSAETFVSGNLYDSRDFTLELSGIIRGYFKTSANTPLPSRVARAVKTVGTDSAEGASDSSGYFYLQNLSTGTYTVTPYLDTLETASPTSATVIMASTGTTTSVSTFTITSGLAEISGQVLIGASSTTVKTGALIVATTSTISATLPPTQNGATGASCSPCYYTGSSDALGNYSLFVRSSATSYKVYGWYSTVTSTGATVYKSAAYTVNVSTPGQIVSQNISW